MCKNSLRDFASCVFVRLQDILMLLSKSMQHRKRRWHFCTNFKRFAFSKGNDRSLFYVSSYFILIDSLVHEIMLLRDDEIHLMRVPDYRKVILLSLWMVLHTHSEGTPIVEIQCDVLVCDDTFFFYTPIGKRQDL